MQLRTFENKSVSNILTSAGPNCDKTKDDVITKGHIICRSNKLGSILSPLQKFGNGSSLFVDDNSQEWYNSGHNLHHILNPQVILNQKCNGREEDENPMCL